MKFLVYMFLAWIAHEIGYVRGSEAEMGSRVAAALRLEQCNQLITGASYDFTH